MTIKNIIFDLGGVLLNMDFDKTIHAFKQLGANNFEAVFAKIQQDQLIDDLEVGNITADQFREKIKNAFNFETTDHEFDVAFTAMLLDLPKERLDFLKHLRQHYKLFLFSNTNEIHLKKFFENCQQQHGFNSLIDYFDKEYYSHLLRKRKPDPEAFLAILKENNLKANETLFVDDTLKNVLSAKNIGLHALHLDEDEELLDIIECVQFIR